MLVSGRFSPHPRGFGFIDLTAPTELTSPTGTTATVDSLFVPPDLARGWLAGDEVKAEALLEEDGRAAATSLALVNRSRRFVVGEVTTYGVTPVLSLNPRIGSGHLPMTPALAEQLKHNQNRQIVAMLTTAEDGTMAAGALVTGPDPTAAPKAIRARAVTIAFGNADPEGIPGGPAAVGLDPVETMGMALRSTGRIAGGHAGLAAGLDPLVGPVPAAERELHDFTEQTCITIDADTTRDLDDAVAAEWDGTAETPVRLTVHIADAAGAVGMGSPADRYARTMGTTAYFVTGPTAPMLDPTLSEGDLSLMPGLDRRALTVIIDIAADGATEIVDIDLSWIRTTARLSYAAVDGYLYSGDALHLARGQHGPYGAESADVQRVAATVDALAEASRRLGVERDARDTLESLFEPALWDATTIDGKIRAVDADPHPEAQRLIERAMVATNEAIATRAAARGVPILYRSHGGFDPDRVKMLRAAAAEIGVELRADDEVPTPGDVLRAIAALREEGREKAAALLGTAATNAVARAAYRATPGEHVAMGSGYYTHFTSPIRRYADLVVHRQVRAVIGGEQPPYSEEELAALAPWLDARAGAAGFAQAIERNELWSILLTRNAIAWPTEAIVTGITPAGLRVRIVAAGVTGFVPAAHVLGVSFRERPRLDVDEHALSTVNGAFGLGQRIRVALDRIDETGRPELKLA